jgi:hypothetical protein
VAHQLAESCSSGPIARFIRRFRRPVATAIVFQFSGQRVEVLRLSAAKGRREVQRRDETRMIPISSFDRTEEP